MEDKVAPTVIAMLRYGLTVLCVLGIACGQILFKLAAQNAPTTGNRLWGLLTSPWLIAAGTLYALTTVLWVWVLTKLPLTAAYPFMALAFVVVPLMSAWLLSEKVGTGYWVGILLIMSGIVVTLVDGLRR